MKKHYPLLMISLVLLTGGCAKRIDVEAERAALRNADIEFAKATAARGVDGWVSYFAEDGSMFPAGGPIVTSKEAIRALMAPAFANPTFSLTWQPAGAEVSRSGDLGYTYGTFESKRNDADRKPSQNKAGSSGKESLAGKPVIHRGKYVTIWRKDADGSWKVVVDIGNQDEPLAATTKH